MRRTRVSVRAVATLVLLGSGAVRAADASSTREVSIGMFPALRPLSGIASRAIRGSPHSSPLVVVWFGVAPIGKIFVGPVSDMRRVPEPRLRG